MRLPFIKYKFWVLAIGVTVALGPIISQAGERQLRMLPVDEADRDPSLVEFRDRMQVAVDHREPERLVELIAPNVYNGLDRESGIRKFAEYWRVDAIDTEIWDVLDGILGLGGGFVRSEKGVQFCMPYVFTEFPDKLDIHEYGAVIRESSHLMKEPSSSSNKVADLSYHLVKIQDWRVVPDMNGTEGQFWLKVSTLDGQEGFVLRQDIRSPSEYSACLLQDQDGNWSLTSLFSQKN